MKTLSHQNYLNGRPFRWLPRHGKPIRRLECLMQTTIKVVAFLPVYTAIVVTLMLLLLVLGVPFVGETRW